MSSELVESVANANGPDDPRIYGVAVAQVVKNCDDTHEGRVQVRLPWLEGYEPWARLSVMDQGTYFIPQKGDEVLVMFNHGDVSEAYIMGQLWNGKDLPPTRGSDDPVNKRIIRTRQGHEIAFDDKVKSITITSAEDKHQITLSPSGIKIATAESTATVTLEKTGTVKIESKTSIELKAETITISGTNVDIGGKSSARIDGGSYCSIAAGQIYIG